MMASTIAAPVKFGARQIGTYPVGVRPACAPCQIRIRQVRIAKVSAVRE
jgi:hypothetical protein